MKRRSNRSDIFNMTSQAQSKEYLRKCENIRDELKSYRAQDIAWSKIYLQDAKYKGIPTGTLFDIMTDRRPIPPEYCYQLGLPYELPAPVCLKCGVVHIKKRCPNVEKAYKRWRDMPEDLLLWALENRG